MSNSDGFKRDETIYMKLWTNMTQRKNWHDMGWFYLVKPFKFVGE